MVFSILIALVVTIIVLLFVVINLTDERDQYKRWFEIASNAQIEAELIITSIENLIHKRDKGDE